MECLLSIANSASCSLKSSQDCLKEAKPWAATHELEKLVGRGIAAVTNVAKWSSASCVSTKRKPRYTVIGLAGKVFAKSPSSGRATRLRDNHRSSCSFAISVWVFSLGLAWSLHMEVKRLSRSPRWTLVIIALSQLLNQEYNRLKVVFSIPSCGVRSLPMDSRPKVCELHESFKNFQTRSVSDNAFFCEGCIGSFKTFNASVLKSFQFLLR